MSKEADVAAVLAAIDRDLPPLRGVVHAAMVLEDALLVNLDRDRMDRVLAPKLTGTWNLHAQTTGRPLDFFVLFSSLSSVFGHAGQGNYAAANAFLDAMAWHRRASGLPALTVNWGYLGEVGYLARRAELGERLERQGVLSFTVPQALALLEKAMQRQHVQVSVMRVEWSRWRGLGVTGRVSPRFAHLCGQAEAGRRPGREWRPCPGATPSWRPIRRIGRAAGRRSSATSWRGCWGRPRIGSTATSRCLQLGIDSLMAVELRNWLEGELRVDLPIVELMRSPSVSGLAELLAERLETVGKATAQDMAARTARRTSRPAVTTGTPRCPLEARPTELLARIDDLSGDQVDALLAALLNQSGHDRPRIRFQAGRKKDDHRNAIAGGPVA